MLTTHSKNADKFLLIGILIILVIGIYVSVRGTPKENTPPTSQTPKTQSSLPSIPANYTLDAYTVAETLPQSCVSHSECETPTQYLLRSNCPYTSLCIDTKCTVVCPNPK